MKRFLILTSMLLMVFFLSTSANAFEIDGMKAVEGRLGVAMPFGDFGDAYDPGFTVGGGFLMGFHEKMAFEANVNYTPFGGDLVDFAIIDFSGGIRYFFMTEGIAPYVGGGIGFYNQNVDIDNVDSENDIGINYGGGLMYGFSETIALDFGLKLNTIFTEDEATNYFSITAGFAYMF